MRPGPSERCSAVDSPEDSTVCLVVALMAERQEWAAPDGSRAATRAHWLCRRRVLPDSYRYIRGCELCGESGRKPFLFRSDRYLSGQRDISESESATIPGCRSETWFASPRAYRPAC